MKSFKECYKMLPSGFYFYDFKFSMACIYTTQNFFTYINI